MTSFELPPEILDAYDRERRDWPPEETAERMTAFCESHGLTDKQALALGLQAIATHLAELDAYVAALDRRN